MPWAIPKSRWRVLTLILISLALCQVGCLVATVGLVGGGAVAAGYLYSKGWYYHEYAAPLDQAATQVHAALAELHMPIVEEKPGKAKINLVCRTGDERKVKISLESVPSPIPAEGFMTRVWVRVTYLGDEEVSTRVLDQVSRHLPTAGVPPSAGAPPAPPVPIQPTSSSHPGESAEPRLVPLPATPTPIQQK